MSLKKETQQQLEKYNVSPNKVLGQNFITDKTYIEKLINASEIDKESLVLEIGPGTGNITKEIAKKAGEVIAIEKDKEMVNILKDALLEYRNIKLIEGDVLKYDFSSIIKNQYSVISAPPYYLTARLFRKFLEESKNPPKTMAIIIQKEVAKKITAKPPKNNLLAVSIKLYSNSKIEALVPKGSFWPTPKVDSAILILKDIKKPNIDEKAFFGLIRAGFSSSRKKLSTNLSKYYKISKKEAQKLLKEADINENSRAENLSINQWKLLLKHIESESNTLK